MGTHESLPSEYGFVLCCEKTIHRPRLSYVNFPSGYF